MQKIKIRSIGVILGLVGLCSINFGFCDDAFAFIGSADYSENFIPGDCFIRTFERDDYGAYDMNGNLIHDFINNRNNPDYLTVYCFNFTGQLKHTNDLTPVRTNLYRFNVSSLYPACEECQECSAVDTGSILSGSCDTNYCVENDLCPVPSNFSTLYINEIEHQSAPVINVSIPREYSRDSTVDSGEFNLVISGQNVDYEYIDGIVRTQKSKPNQIDFNNIVSGLMPLFIPGLVVILFIWFIFRFIKKIF